MQGRVRAESNALGSSPMLADPAERVRYVPGMLEYTLADYDPAHDGDEVEWARALDAQGWRVWHATGVWVTINGRQLRRWSVRRRVVKNG